MYMYIDLQPKPLGTKVYDYRVYLLALKGNYAVSS